MITSDNFPDDPLAYAGNQAGHFAIGLGLWLLAAVVWPGAGEWAVAAVGATYFIGIEWAWQRLKLFWDSVEDAAHVALGALFGLTLHHYGPASALGLFSLWVVILGLGMWRRWT